MKRVTNILLTISRDDNNIIKVDTTVLKEKDIVVHPKEERKAKYHPPVMQYDWKGNPIKQWDSIKKASLDGGFSYNGITNVCKGKIETHRGYRWRYIDQTVEGALPLITEPIK